MNQAHALIIDDQPNNVRVLAEMLSDQGLSSTSLLDPKQLDATMQNMRRVDVVFLDMEFPGMDGYEIFKRLKDYPLLQNVPVVAYTVHVSEMPNIQQFGYHSFLSKPLDSDKFPGQLSRILEGQPVWDRF